MRYILTGKYANGDDYGDATESLEELADMLRELAKAYDDMSIDPSWRIDITTLKIETEEA